MARRTAEGKPPAARAAPAVSVIVVVYESGPTLGQCLAAVRAQSFAGYELMREAYAKAIERRFRFFSIWIETRPRSAGSK